LSITAIKTGLATNLATISGLRTSAEVPDNPNPPQAVIQLQSVNYDGAFKQGLTTYNFLVSVIVGRVDERNAQKNLDAYASSSGSKSIKLAVQSDKSLSGTAFDVRVTDMTNIGAVLLSDATYLAADFVVTVYAN
jgi:hypothetical protein|tara:strand:- start:892 stop:1296 length:405 start_codon:yes stop_codon:yes gene_type:complete